MEHNENIWLYVNRAFEYYLDKTIKAVTMKRESSEKDKLVLAKTQQVYVEYVNNPELLNEEEDRNFVQARDSINDLFMTAIKNKQ